MNNIRKDVRELISLMKGFKAQYYKGESFNPYEAILIRQCKIATGVSPMQHFVVCLYDDCSMRGLAGPALNIRS
jgi:hypothetical protein